MDRRKKRTSTNQYMMYIDLMEKDSIFATGRVPRDVDVNYLQKKWKNLSDKLNSCSSGPTLTAEEWRKRLNDWKNTTRCKYRRNCAGEKGISMTSLEMKALDLFGKAPQAVSTSEQPAIYLKSEKDENEEEMEQQHTSEAFQKELQAAVEEAIGDEVDEVIEEQDETDDMNSDPLATPTQNSMSATTYRTIVVENSPYADENTEEMEFISSNRRSDTSAATTSVATGVQTVATNASALYTPTKLINGEIPMKRLRTQPTEHIIYEVKKAIPRLTTIPQHQTTGAHKQGSNMVLVNANGGGVAASGIMGAEEAREIARHLKRLADIKSKKLDFEVARFKFKNPGFNFNFNNNPS